MALFQEYVLCLLTSDVCMEQPAHERLHKVSPACTHFPVRNGLVNQVEFLQLITKKMTNEIARSVIITQYQNQFKCGLWCVSFSIAHRLERYKVPIFKVVSAPCPYSLTNRMSSGATHISEHVCCAKATDQAYTQSRNRFFKDLLLRLAIPIPVCATLECNIQMKQWCRLQLIGRWKQIRQI